MSRSLYRFLARLLVASLLFAQLAVSAYACPEDAAEIASAEMAGMQDCPYMSQHDKDMPNLCAEHCHPGQQLTPHADVPSVPLALPVGFFVVLPAHDFSPAPPAARYADVLTLASSPPHSILHCCFRI
ncbi:MAG TPA: hypothetical protein VLC92_16390 [Rhodocyclaceae bacterium]|nr:hypothetical protein [Rhodocyclaceae bacterium]